MSEFAEERLEALASIYNSAAQRLGDDRPDFISAVTDLTSSSCGELNKIVPDRPDVYYQSVGSILNSKRGGRFPSNYSYELVRYFDGPNDGLVGQESMRWGENFRLVTNKKGKRGISHGDMIDLNRENFHGFDVREFYVQLVADLKERQL